MISLVNFVTYFLPEDDSKEQIIVMTKSYILPEDGSKEQNMSNHLIEDSTFTSTTPSSKDSVDDSIRSKLNESNEDIPLLDGKRNEISTNPSHCEKNQTEQCVQSNFSNHDSTDPFNPNHYTPTLKRSPDELVLLQSKNIITISSEEEDENIPCIDRLKPNQVSNPASRKKRSGF